jgi:hypothetical protein
VSSNVTAFQSGREIASGERDAVTRLLKERDPVERSSILVFEDETGRVTDLDYENVLQAVQRGAGRPKLGVQAREVTLLPRHWEWLARQPGGASGTLRRLVEEARRGGRSERERRDAAYHFMQASCGDWPGYEEALRALYKGEDGTFQSLIAGWPEDARRYIGKLLAAEQDAN